MLRLSPVTNAIMLSQNLYMLDSFHPILLWRVHTKPLSAQVIIHGLFYPLGKEKFLFHQVVYIIIEFVNNVTSFQLGFVTIKLFLE